MSGILWRILIAIVAVAIAWNLIPPVARLLHFDVSSDMITVLRYVISGLAVFYILLGRGPSWPAERT